MVNNWFDLTKTTKFRAANKIIIKEYEIFYNKCWLERNTILYSKEMQHEFLIKWYNKTKTYGKSIRGEAVKFIDTHKIDTNKDSNRTIKEWI